MIISLYSKFILGREKQCVCCKVGTELFRVRQSSASKLNDVRFSAHDTATLWKIFWTHLLSSGPHWNDKNNTETEQNEGRNRNKQNRSYSLHTSDQCRYFLDVSALCCPAHIQYTAAVQWMIHVTFQGKWKIKWGHPRDCDWIYVLISQI